MQKLTKKQLRLIKSIINDHMNIVLLITTGDGKPSPELLKKLNISKSEAESLSDLLTKFYKYGKLSVLKSKNLSSLSEDELKKLIKTAILSPSQKRAVEFSKIRTQQYIEDITQRISSQVVSIAVQNELTMWQTANEIVPQAIEDNIPRFKVIQQLREKSGEMERDWHRVAHTELWTAKCNGEVNAILNNESPLTSKGSEAKVYVKPAHNACNKCKQLYLEDDGITPKVFNLADLVANGNNYGKKQAQWLPTVPCLHPNCLCVINVKPDDTEFDANGYLVYKKNGGV